MFLKKHYKLRCLLVAVLAIFVHSPFYAQADYYAVLGIASKEPYKIPGHEIRRLCIIKLDEVAKTLEPNKAKLDKDIQDAKKAGRSAPEIQKLEADQAQLHQQITFIKSACEILQDPRQRAEYDKKLGVILGEEAAKAKEATEIQQYCEARLGIFGQQKQNVEQELKIAQRASLPEKQIQELQSGVAMLDQKIAEVRGTCTILANPKHPQYKETLEKIREEQRQEEEEEKSIFGKIKKTILGSNKDVDVKIAGMVGNFLSMIPIPDVSARIFNQNLAMRNMQFIAVESSLMPAKLDVVPTLPVQKELSALIPGQEELGLQKKVKITGPKIRKGIGFTGTMNFNRFQVKATMLVIEDVDRKMQYSFSMQLPEYYKISDMFPQFKKLDVLSLPQGKFVISSFDYKDMDGYDIRIGFNFNAGLDLSGPLQALGDLMKKAPQLDSIVVRLDAPIHFHGVIPRDITKTTFNATIPLRFGINFTKIPKIPKSITDIIRELTTDDLVFGVTAPPKISFSVESGVRLVLGTQDDPLRLTLFGIVEPQMLSLGIRLRNMLELKFIALGNAGVQFDLDQALMPIAIAFGIPFTGMGVHGEVELGTKNAHRVTMKVAGGFRVSGTSIPDVVLDAEVTNLHFGNIVNLVSKVMAKAGIAREIPADKIPVMNIDRAKGYLVLEDTKIAGKEYSAGFGLVLDAQLFDKKFGFAFDVKHKKLTAAGLGYMSKVDFTARGNRIFTLSGPGMPGITEDGPVVYCDFNFSSPQKFLEGKFGIKTLLEIPPIALSSKVDMEIKGKAFKADLEATYVGFTSVFGINIDPEKWREMHVKFGFKGDFEKFLSEQAKPVLEELRQQANEKLAQVDKKIGDLSKELTKLQASGTSETQREIDKTRATIQRIEKKIAALKKECSDAPILKKTYICPKVGVEITGQGTALAAQKTYLETLLKPGKAVIQATTGALADASKAISDAQVFKKSVTGFLTGVIAAIDGIAKGSTIFRVTEAVGDFSATELVEGKLPKLTSFKAEVNIPELPSVKVVLKDIQFNFKNPRQSATDIAKKILSGVKISS